MTFDNMNNEYKKVIEDNMVNYRDKGFIYGVMLRDILHGKLVVSYDLLEALRERIKNFWGVLLWKNDVEGEISMMLSFLPSTVIIEILPLDILYDIGYKILNEGI